MLSLVKQLWLSLLLLVSCHGRKMKERIKVQQGMCANLPCDVTYPRKFHVIKWSKLNEEKSVLIKTGDEIQHIDKAFRGRVSIPNLTSFPASLFIENVTLGDAGVYECLILFPRIKTKINTSVELEVTAPPKFTHKSRPEQHGRIGGSLMLECSAEGEPPPVITWKKNQHLLGHGGSGIEINGGNLRIHSLQRFHSGKYECEANSVEGKVQHVMQVFVSAPPEIYEKPQNAIVNEGKTATFSCSAKGYPSRIEYRWRLNGASVKDLVSKGGKLTVIGRGTGSTLVIQNISTSDRGTVTCEASNGFGSPSRASAKLVVKFAARVTGMPPLIHAGVGRSVTLYCPAVAEPPINKYKWKKKGREIAVHQNYHFSTHGNGSLIINNLNHGDTGRYVCTPYNQLGTRKSGTTFLVVKDLPRFSVKPLSVYKTGVGREFTASCEGTGDPMPTVSWRKLPKKNVKVPSYCQNNGNLTIASVRKQHHGIWQCVLSSHVGDVSANVKIIVQNSTPQAVENITATALNDSTIRITWDPGYNGGFTQHFIVWYKELNKRDHSWKQEYIPTDHKTAIVTHLKPDTVYQLSVVAKNHNGLGEFSETVTLKTQGIPQAKTPPPLVLLPSPTHLSYVINENGSITLSWKPTCCFNELLGFLIEYRHVGKAIKKAIEPLISNAQGKSKIKKKAKRSFTDILAQSQYETELFRHRRSLLRGKWETLDTTPHNVTSYEIDSTKLYRDQIYEFQVLAVTPTQYSQPSPVLVVSTRGLMAYPVFVSTNPATMAGLRHPVLAAVIVGLVFVSLMVLFAVFWVRRKKAAKSKKYKPNDEAADYQSVCSNQETERPKDVALASPPNNLRWNYNIPDVERESRSVIASHPEDDAETSARNLEQGFTDEDEEANLCHSIEVTDEDIKRNLSLSSVDRESVQKRRETTAKVLLAQRAEKQRNIAGNSTTDFPVPGTTSSSTCPNYRNLFICERGKLDPDQQRSLIPQVPLEDRRNLQSRENKEDSVYVVVQSDICQSPVPCNFFALHDTGNLQSSSSEQNTASPSKSIIPFYHRRSILDKTLKTEPCTQYDVSKLHPPHSHPLALSPIKSFSSKQENSFFSNKSGEISDLCIPNREQTSSLNRKFIKKQKNSYFRDQNQPPAFEIDCSKSDIEVRVIKDNLYSLSEHGSEQPETTYPDLKVGSNQVDESRAAERKRSPAKALHQNNETLRNRHESTKRRSLDFCSSYYDFHSNALSKIQHKSTIPTIASSPSLTKNKHREKTVSHRAYSDKDISNCRALSPVITEEHSSTIEQIETKNSYRLQHNQSYLSSEVPPKSPALSRTECNSTYTVVSDDLKYAKPTIISLADLPSWELMAQSRDSGSFTARLSPTSPQASPNRFKLKTPNRSFVKLSPSRNWGSLGRSFKPPRFASTSVSSKTLQDLEFSNLCGTKSSSNHFSTNTFKTFRPHSGVQSLPVSPIKADKPNLVVLDRQLLSKFKSSECTNTSDIRQKKNNKRSVSKDLSTSFSKSISPSTLSLSTSKHNQNFEDGLNGGKVIQSVSPSSPGCSRVTGERSRKDNSSVEDNYEWDSEYAIDLEMSEAIKSFETLKRTSSMSEKIIEKINKFVCEVNGSKQDNKTAFPKPGKNLSSNATSKEEEISTTTKETIRQRCAALRVEYRHHQKLKEKSDGKEAQKL